MSRFLSALLTIIMLFSLSACGKTEAEETPVTEDPVVEEPVTEEPEPEPEPTPEELAAEEIETLLSSMTLEEKVGQLFFVRCPAENAAEDVASYHLGGYILFARDFKDGSDNWLTREQVMENIASYQTAAMNDTGIPLLIGSDEEGGTVTRASRNPNLFEKKFPSPQTLAENQHDHGDVFAEDAWERSNALLALGINVPIRTTSSMTGRWDRMLAPPPLLWPAR